MMSSRYYPSYASYRDAALYQPSYARQSKQSSYYYSKSTSPSRQQYSYQPASAKSPKASSKTRSSAIRDSGKIPGPYSPTLGRRKPMGHWKAKKKKEEEEKKMQRGDYQQEVIEEELQLYKKGVFMFNDKSNSKTLQQALNGHSTPKRDQSTNKHAKYQLTKTQKPPPQVFAEVDELPRAVPPNYEERIKSNDLSPSDPIKDDDDTKESSIKKTKTSKPSSSSSTRQQQQQQTISKSSQSESQRNEDKSQRPKKILSRPKRQKKTRIQPMVTVSPSRGPLIASSGLSPYGAFAAAPPPRPADYYYAAATGGYTGNYGAPPPPSYFADPYGSYATSGQYPYSADPYYGRGAAAASYSTDPYAAGYGGASSYVAPDPYYGTTQPVPIHDPYATPKASKRSRRDRDSANVDLTTPLVDKLNGDIIKKEKLSPGRRVNKIQKQLEYYFSVQNMNHDEFLRKAMDKEGYVPIETVMAFNRMKVLDATKELVIEAAFHSTIIEIEPKQQDKIRMTSLWKQYVRPKKEKRSSSSKKKSSSSRERRQSERAKEKAKEQELDNAEVNPKTIDQIVAGIEKKAERRQKRREQREKMKKQKEKEKEEKKEKEKEVDNDNDGDDDDDKEKKENEEEMIKKIKKKNEESEPPTEVLIEEDLKRKEEDPKGGDDDDDMDIID